MVWIFLIVVALFALRPYLTYRRNKRYVQRALAPYAGLTYGLPRKSWFSNVR